MSEFVLADNRHDVDTVTEGLDMIPLEGTTVALESAFDKGSGGGEEMPDWLVGVDVARAAKVASKDSPIGRTTGLVRIIEPGGRTDVVSSLPPVAVCWLSRWLRRFAICERRNVCIKRGPRDARNLSVVAVFTGGAVAMLAILYMADGRNMVRATVLELLEVLVTDCCEIDRDGAGNFSTTIPVFLSDLLAVLLASSTGASSVSGLSSAAVLVLSARE